MNAEYRVVHFVPNPLVGAQVPVAALVRSGDSVRVLQPRSMPEAECLGSRRAATLLHAVRPYLERMEDFANLPVELGPLFILGKVQRVPAGDGDPIAFLEEALFPKLGNPKRVNVPRRSTVGRKWLTRNGVAEAAIGKRFRPSHVHIRAHADPVTHFVRGANGLLLMEPIVAARCSDVRSAVGSAATRLRATAHVLSTGGYTRELGFIAYVLPGASEEAVGMARDAMAFEGGSAVNCAVRAQADAFTSRINGLAEPLPFH